MGKETKNNNTEGPAVKPAEDLVAINTKKKEDIRKKHNSEILNKMKGGDPLTSFNSMDSWFPPRPKIEKDKELMGKLYSDTPKKSSTIPGKVAKGQDRETSENIGDGNQQKSKAKNSKGKSHLRPV